MVVRTIGRGRMPRAIAIGVTLLAALVTPIAANAGCAGGYFTFTNTLCSGPLQLRICLADRGNSLLFTLRRGESTAFQTAPNSSYSWSCSGEPAAFCPSAYCVNGPDRGGPTVPQSGARQPAQR
jgi:hypothetical protein